MRNPQFVEVNLPNVDLKTYADKRTAQFSIPIKNMGLRRRIAPLIEALAPKHPEWTFKCVDGSITGGQDEDYALMAEKFAIFEKREMLGTIETDFSYGRGKDMFCISNHRAAEKLRRSNSLKTSDVAKAVKLVEKHFHPRLPDELLDMHREQVIAAIGGQVNRKESTSMGIRNKLEPHLMQFMRGMREQFIQCVGTPDAEELVSKYLTLDDEVNLLMDMREALSVGKAIQVLQQDGVYYLETSEGVVRSEPEELTDDVKHKLGILKLVQDGQAVSKIGFRHNDSVFVLYGV